MSHVWCAGVLKADCLCMHWHSLNFPKPSVIAAHGGGARAFCSMGSGPLIGTARDPLEDEFEARSTDAGVLVKAHFGRTEARALVPAVLPCIQSATGTGCAQRDGIEMLRLRAAARRGQTQCYIHPC